MTKDKCGKEWEAILIGRIVVIAQGCMEVLRLTPPNELAQACGNGQSVEFLLGQFLLRVLDTALDQAQLRRIHVLMLLRTALDLHQIAAKLRGRLFRSSHNRVVEGINLIVLQFLE
jgi:hypothetical protein